MRNYEDIRNHERYQLKHHTPMSLESRAAQFAPFAALVGYDEEIGEAARSTDGREELSEDAIDALNQAFQKLLGHEEERPLVTVTYFQPDTKKDGGRYMTYTGNFRFYDAEKRVMKFVDGMVIGVEQMCRIEIK
ncbi:hypothetical protein [uncultured Ruminococcus sp.]|jgi:hypothetical protein|uniref:hypothetical protein n=1 Tax=uncultured Ruminococcus sp. TaxID=165186 RepID=UPI00266D047D|nr:hypothetical protein [uncultured Ruminococcus sp.]